MPYSFDYQFPGSAESSAMLAAMIPTLLISMLIGLSVSVIMYVLNALAVTKLSRARNLNNPWLAWIPFCDGYALGRLSDDINRVQGKRTSHRKILLAMEICTGVLIGAGMIMMFDSLWGMIMNMLLHDRYFSEADLYPYVSFLLISSGVLLLSLVFAVIMAVYQYIALYNVFKVYARKNAILFLVLSIFINYCQPIFLFVIRNNRPEEFIPTPNGYPPYPSYQNYQNPYNQGGYQNYQSYQGYQNYQPNPYQQPGASNNMQNQAPPVNPAPSQENPFGQGQSPQNGSTENRQ